MQGFIHRSIPLFAAALDHDGAGDDRARDRRQPVAGARAEQVALSFGIPFALIPLVMFCRNRELMGDLVNRRGDDRRRRWSWRVIVALNIFLLSQLILG